MKELNKIIYAIEILIILIGNSSCNNVSFTPEEMKFVTSFDNERTVIYKSEKGQIDTIHFFQKRNKITKIQHIEVGFYNQNVLSVDYELSMGSFHKITVKAINTPHETFLNFIKNSDSYSSKKINFLGLVFDNDYINIILNTNDSIIRFDQENALYNGVNINEGIKSFDFSFNKGVVSFIDEYGVKWNRIN